MPRQTLVLNGKNVFLSEPYTPDYSSDHGLVGREHELRMATAAWIAQPGLPALTPLLVGEPGVGKNRFVYELAQASGKELYIFQGHEDVTAEQLASSARFSDDADRKIDYILSPLATALLRGGICFIDELDKLRPRALAPLGSVLEERRYLDSIDLGERIHAHPGFRFIAATNSLDLSGDGLPEFIQSRLRPVIPIPYPSWEELHAIVKHRFFWIEEGTGALFRDFWALWREYSPDARPTPRDTLYLFGLTYNLSAMENRSEGSLLQEARTVNRGEPQRPHLEAAFRQFFQEKGGCDVEPVAA